MTKLHILGVPALVLVMLAPDAMAQRRGGGAVSGGVRGAMVGGLVGGSEGAQTGAKVGAVTGATRAAVDREAQRRAEYQTSAEYQNAPHSDFNTAPPQVLATTPPAATAPAAAATASGGEALIRKDGKPVIGITYPSDWKQTTGDRYVSAVSADGQAYSMIATLEGAADNQAGIAKVKQGLEKYLQDIQYDNLTKTKRGASCSPAREGEEVRRRRGVRGWGLRYRRRATRRGGICRRCPHRGALQGNGPPDLPGDSRRRPVRREEVGSAEEARCQSGRGAPGPTVLSFPGS